MAITDAAALQERYTAVEAARAEVAPGARLLAGEIIVFGRRAMGERLTAGLIREAWEVCRVVLMCT